MKTMQLILTPPATKDINIKMSTQTDSPINGEIRQIYKLDKETVPAIEKTLINDTESELPASKNNVLEGENLDAKTNGNKNCILENTIEEGDLIESVSSDVSNNISKETDCAQDANELECKTHTLEMTNAEEVATKNTVDLKLSLLNNSKNSKCLTKLEIKSGLANTDEPLCENKKKIPKDITATSSFVSINVPVTSLESDLSNADDFLMDEEIYKPSEIIKDACDSKTEKNNKDSNCLELSTTDSTYSEDVLDQENRKVFQESVDIVTNKEPNILINEEVTDLAMLLDDKDVTMPTDENLILIETEDRNSITIDEEVLSPIQTSKTVISTESLELVEMEDECLSLQSDKNLASTVAEDVSPIKIDEEVLSVVQTCEEVILSKVNTLKPIKISEGKLQSNVNSDQCTEIDDVTMTELETTSENIVALNIDQLVEDSSEINYNNNQETDVFLDDSNKIYEQDKATIGDEKNKDSDSMEIDDKVKNINVVKDNLTEMPNNIDTTLSKVVSKDTIIEDTTKLEVTSEIAVEQKLSENIVLKKTKLECIKGKDKTESEESSIIILEKEPNEIIFTTENPENAEISKAAVENSRVSGKNIEEKVVRDLISEDQENIEIIDEDDVNIIDIGEEKTKVQSKEKSPERKETTPLPVVCKLSNTLDILSDDEEEESNVLANEQSENCLEEKQCINLDDDDDIMLIEEDFISKETTQVLKIKEVVKPKPSDEIDVETGGTHTIKNLDLTHQVNEKDTTSENISSMELDSVPETEDQSETEDRPVEPKKPLLPENLLKTAKKNLAGMSRYELEDFCILRIVESIVDRSNLSEIKTKMKNMAVRLDDFKKRAMMLTKQNRDLQVVLKSVQEEQKKKANAPIQPLKITRSVGMQVTLLSDKGDPRRKVPISNPGQATVGPTGTAVRAGKHIKPPATPPSIPVPRKVPVNNSPAKILPANIQPSLGLTINVVNKPVSPHPNGLKNQNPSPVQKAPEKRTHSRTQGSSVTVDLTDDEPPAKVPSTKSSPSHPVRVVAPQNLLAQQRQFPALNNNARKVYIPISGTQAQQIRSGHAIMMKNVVNPVKKLDPRIPRLPPGFARPKVTTGRHPAPLPESMKQYTPPAWKALPPAPDLKLSKVENGIVISWKIEGISDGTYETIASYQLYAYQETPSPPSTSLWKKIGDVKALPLPMACTLTQFMAGFKYYFAVRAVDVRSRLGPFSLPGSILLLNKV